MSYFWRGWLWHPKTKNGAPFTFQNAENNLKLNFAWISSSAKTRLCVKSRASSVEAMLPTLQSRLVRTVARNLNFYLQPSTKDEHVYQLGGIHSSYCVLRPFKLCDLEFHLGIATKLFLKEENYSRLCEQCNHYKVFWTTLNSETGWLLCMPNRRSC